MIGPVGDAVRERRESLGKRLREIRCRAGLTGRELASLSGWNESKVSKIEYAVYRPSATDIRDYCHHTGSTDQLDGLLASLREIDAATAAVVEAMRRAERRLLEHAARRPVRIDWQAFASAIKQRRGGRTFVTVAAEIGIAKGTILRAEHGRGIDLNNFAQVCRWLGIPACRFIGTDDCHHHPVIETASTAKEFE